MTRRSARTRFRCKVTDAWRTSSYVEQVTITVTELRRNGHRHEPATTRIIGTEGADIINGDGGNDKI